MRMPTGTRAGLVGLVALAVMLLVTRDRERGTEEDERASPSPTGRGTGAGPAEESRPTLVGEAPAAREAAAPSSPAPSDGPRLRGRVTRPDGTPLPGARVAVVLERGEVREDLGGTATDGEGRYALDLPALAALSAVARRAGLLRVRASARRHRSAEAEVLLGEDTPLDRPADFVLRPGGMLRGRVLAPDGTLAGGVQVLVDPSPAGGYPSTDAEGAYEVEVAGAGDHRLTVEARGLGTGTVGPVYVDPARDVEAPDLRLRGTGTVAGRARFPDGTPAAGVVVVATARDATPAASPPDGPVGLRASEARTDEAGRFAVRGLAEGGVYALAHEHGRDPSDGAVRRTGATDAEVTVRLRRVRVQVVDEAGAPVPGAGYAVRWTHASGGEDFEAGDVLPADAAFDVWGEPGDRFDVAAEVTGEVASEATVTVDEARWDERVTLVLRPPAGRPGRLRVVVTGPDGERVRDFTATLETEGGRIVAGIYEATGDAEGRLPPAPGGPYVLTVHPGRRPNGPPVEPYFRVTSPVRVEPDGESVVPLRARRGARVRLLVRRADGDAAGDEDRVRISAEARPRDGGPPVPLGAFVVQRGEGSWTMGGLRFGETGTAVVLLEPGVYDVRVAAEGFEPVDVPIDARAGTTEPTEVVLRRR